MIIFRWLEKKKGNDFWQMTAQKINMYVYPMHAYRNYKNQIRYTYYVVELQATIWPDFYIYLL
jgi:hypothetical protein